MIGRGRHDISTVEGSRAISRAMEKFGDPVIFENSICRANVVYAAGPTIAQSLRNSAGRQCVWQLWLRY